MRGRELRRVLSRNPLSYKTVRQRGSHRTLESPNGYPQLIFSFHDRQEIPPRVVKKILVQDVGLDEDHARRLV
jgi:predicted RNA binding protein YcfA (HicA-like mRNA interferase family)